MNKNCIFKGIGGFYYVKSGNEILECKPAGILRKMKISPLPGDYVVPELSTGTWIINEILPRKNEFVRPRVANVDNFFIVVSTVEPVPSTLVIDKMTAIAVDKGAIPYILITKTDLSTPTQLIKDYLTSGIDVIVVDAKTREGFDKIIPLFKNKISVFCGNSGVGKSTLLSELIQGKELNTGTISKKLGRGRHTTREVEFFELFDGLVADTPGFASLDINAATYLPKENLQLAFPDLACYFGKCKFTGCAHIFEKGCAVLAAVENGELSKTRYSSYKSMYEQADKLKDWER